MKARRDLSAAQVDALIERLRLRLERILPETQPEIAQQIIKLMEDPDSVPADFAGVIKHDPTLCGRILRVANSALFAQRNPVTTPERACMLLGLQRIRGITLGFHLSKAARGGPEDLSRRIWGESIFRGCVAGMLGGQLLNHRSAEAFLIGLMLDTGIPLLQELAGDAYSNLLGRELPPHELFRQEHRLLPCTHVDVIAALCRIWELPETLRKPIERHHQLPKMRETADEIDILHRIAYFVGGLDLKISEESVQPGELSENASSLLGISDSELRRSIDETVGEYETLVGVFGEAAEAISDLDSLCEVTHRRLSDAADDLARTSFVIDGMNHAEEFSFSFGLVRVEVEGPSKMLAVLLDSKGDGIVSYRFNPETETAGMVVDALGLEPDQEPAVEELAGYLRNVAA